MFWVNYPNSNTFHVKSLVRLKNMQKIWVNAFLLEMEKLIVWIDRITIVEIENVFGLQIQIQTFFMLKKIYEIQKYAILI
jgi:hypothetical protein